MKMKKVLAMMAVVSMTAVMTAGCGGSDSAESGSTDAAESGSTEKSESADAGSDFDAANDIAVTSREDGSGTRGAFIELFGIEEKDADGKKIDNTTEEAAITNSTSVMMSTVAGDEYAIGYISLGSMNDTIKALKVEGAEATEENIKDGSYKVSRPFNIVTKGETSDVTADFISYILSEEGQAVVSENGYISLDDVKPYDGNKPAGKVVVAGSSSVSPVMEKLKEAYLKVNTSAEIEIQTSDSTTGVTSTIDGICDIGMASRELKEEEAKEVEGTVIATDGIAVIVNKANPIDDIETEQVKEIYTGEVLAWDEVE